MHVIKALEKMDPIKRENLIDSAMKEFGKNGYDKASTNIIVKDAGISKGILFHYFPTKRELFETLSIYSITLIGDQIESKVDWQNGDITKRLEEITMIKLGLFKKYPHLLDFSKNIFNTETLEEIKEKIYQHMPNYHQKVFELNIDHSIFKSDLDVSKTITFLQYFLDRYSEDLLNTYIRNNKEVDLSYIEKDLKSYLEIYRKGFYKS